MGDLRSSRRRLENTKEDDDERECVIRQMTRVEIDRCSNGYYVDSLDLQHKNVLQVRKFDTSNKNVIYIVYEKFDCSLASLIPQKGYFWVMSGDTVTGVHPFLVKLLKDLVSAAICLYKNDLSHRRLDDPHNIAIFEDALKPYTEGEAKIKPYTEGEAKIWNFEGAGPGGMDGFHIDLEGIARLVQLISSEQHIRFEDLPVEVTSFVSYLRSRHAAENSNLIHQHPLLLTIEEKKEFYLNAGKDRTTSFYLTHQIDQGHWCIP